MKVVQFAKDHPYLTAGGVFAVGLLLVLMFSGGTSEEVVDGGGGMMPYVDPNATMANAALVQSQISAQVEAKALDNALAKAQSDNDTAWKVAQKQYDTLNNANILNADVVRAGYATDIRLGEISSATTLGVAKYAADTQKFVAQKNAETAMASFDRDRYVTAAAADVEKYRIGNDTLKSVTLATNQAWKETSLAIINRDLEFEKVKRGMS